MLRGTLRQSLLCGLTLLGLGWGFPVQTQAVNPLPIHGVTVNHVEVESVLDYTPPAMNNINDPFPTLAKAIIDPASLLLGPTPIVLETTYAAAVLDSPFGFHPAGVGAPGYPDNGFVDAQNIGVTWQRPPVYAFWFMVQPDLNFPLYDWTLPDSQYAPVPVGINILANIAPDGPGGSRCLSGSWIPVDIPEYTAFVQATVERYDGDGLNDMPGLVNPVKYWQVGNEPGETFISDFAVLQQISYQAIKQACADCTVLIGGVGGFPDDYIAGFDVGYAPILADLAGQYVDVLDFHWYGTATGEYRLTDTATGQDVYQHIRDTLAANGFPSGLPIWITEMGCYSGDPPASPFPPFTVFPPQTERQQAGDTFRRFLYSLSRGVQKVFPAFGVIEGFVAGNRNYFDHTGLIYNGIGQQDPDYPDADPDDLGLGVKKLGYYTYKKMTEKLDGADWTTVALLRDGTGTDQLYLVSVVKNGQPVYAAWWDTFDEPGYTPGDTKNITLTGLSGAVVIVTTVVPFANVGQDVTDYTTAFTMTAVPIAGGAVTVPLAEDPVIIETRIRGDFDGNGSVDLADLDVFVAVLIGLDADPVRAVVANMNGDGTTDGADIQPFVGAIVGG